MNQAKTKTDESIPNPTSDRLEEVLHQLTADQKRFIVARQSHTSDRSAAESIDISPNTVKNWKVKGAPIDEAVDLMAHDGVVVALHVRRENLAKAMLVKVAGLDSEDERMRQNVATEVIEWELGKATQPTKLGGTGEDGAFIVRVVGGINPEDV